MRATLIVHLECTGGAPVGKKIELAKAQIRNMIRGSPREADQARDIGTTIPHG